MNRFLNRQKQLMLAMAGVMMLTVSCSQDVDNELGTTDATGSKVGSEVKLQFATNAVTTTRGTMYDNISVMPDDSKFSVYGYSCKGGFDQMGTAPNFIANGEASKDGTVTVDDAVKHYNSQEPYVQLAAVYPKLEGNNSFEKTGIDKYSLTYDLGANIDATQHKDLMVGKTNVEVQMEGEQQPAKITLHHALTGINFAIGDKCPTGYYIVGIEMQGLAAKGTCEVTFSGDMPTFNWTPSDTKENIRLKWPKYEVQGKLYTITPNKTTQVNRTQVTGVLKDGKRDNLTIFMIPQQLGADAKAVIWLTEDNDTHKTTRPSSDKDHRAAIKKLTIGLADVKAWNPGQVVVYRIDEELKDADLQYKFNLRPSTIESQPGADGLSAATFQLLSYRYTYSGKIGKITYDAYAALQSFQIIKYAYEDETGMHETVTNELPDWITLAVTPKPLTGRSNPFYDMAVKVDHTKPSYPDSIKKLLITFKQDNSEMDECTMEITNLQPKASN